MTYPPQPGQPYGQQGAFPQQPGGYPQPYPQGAGVPGSYPQPGGVFPDAAGGPAGTGGAPGGFPPAPHSGAFPQQPYVGQGYGPYPGYGPPQKNRTTLWVGLTVGLVVVLAALGITGFWQPGFFLGKDSPGATPEATLRGIVDGLNQHNATALLALTCPDANPVITSAISRVSGVNRAELLSGPTKVSETEYDGVINLTYLGDTAPFTGKLAKENGNWCWKDVIEDQST